MGIKEFFKAKTIAEYFDAKKDPVLMAELTQRTKKQVVSNLKKSVLPTTHTSVELDKDTETVLQAIKIDFDSRYTPEEYHVGDNLVPDVSSGLVVLLWWLSKNDVKKDYVPSYFYFQYGATADQLIRRANSAGYMNGLDITESGYAHLVNNDDIIERHRGNPKKNAFNRKKLVDSYTPDTDIDFSRITFSHFDDLSDEEFKQGSNLLSIAEGLTKEKRYQESMLAVIEALNMGYQAPAVWYRAAINARYLKNLTLEENILNLGLQSMDFDTGNTTTSERKFKERLNKVHELQSKQSNVTYK